LWLQYGNPPLYPWIAGFTRAAPSSVVRAAIFTISRTRQNLLLTWLTRFGALAYIAPTRRAAARRDGAPAKLLTDNGDQTPMCFNRGCRLRRLSGLFGERGFAVPGCLTGESEERETWTAESLRAASSGGSIPGSIPAQLRPDETSAVHVSGQHHFREAEGVGATRVGLMSTARTDEVGPRQTL